jgi:hypothetical protein
LSDSKLVKVTNTENSCISTRSVFHLKIGFAILFSIFISLHSNAQFLGFYIDDENERTSFRFELINNLIVVPVVINDTINLNFILDTGVRATILTDNTLTNFDLAKCRPVHIIGAGIMNEVEAFVVSNVSFRLPGITSPGLSIVALKEDYLHLQNHLGMAIHGILGYDFFSQFVVKIDYESKIITVIKPDKFKPGKRFVCTDIKLFHGRPYLLTNFLQYNNTIVNARLLIDTGASHAIMLETDSDSTIYVPDNSIETIVGWGLGGELIGELGRIDSLHLSQFHFKDVLCTFIPGYGQNLTDKIPDRKGSIGGELLGRFTIILDYKNEKVYLRKNSRIKRDFEYNLSGIDLVAIGTNFKLYKVIHIIPNSPADLAGVKIGDLILGINGQIITEMSIQEVNGFFRTRPKNRIRLIILRDQNLENISFRLARLI